MIMKKTLLERPLSSQMFATSFCILINCKPPSPSSSSIIWIFCRGWQGLIAQGCHSSILIIDPKTAQTIQVLERHKANVVKVSYLSIYFLCTCLAPFNDFVLCIWLNDLLI